MNAKKLAVGIFFVVLASKTCTLAMSQDLQQPSEAIVSQADPPEHRVLLSAAQGENANRAGPDERTQRASSVTVPASESTASPSDRQPTAPSIAKAQDEGVAECHRRSCNDPCPSFYGQVEALFLKREPRFIHQPLVVNDTTGETLMSTSDLGFNFDPGVRATVGMRLCEGRALEFSYFGLFEGTASAVVVKPDPAAYLIFPNNLVGNAFKDMSRVQVNYSSWLNSFEANLPCCCGCCDESGCSKVSDECGCGKASDECGCGEVRCRSFEWFTGFRYVNLGERLDIETQRIVAGVEYGSYDIRTANHLYGAQIGARLRRSLDRFGWEATGKAGIFGNDAQQSQSVIDSHNFPLPGRTVSSSRGGVACLSELNLSALYRLTDIWNLKVGYNAMWIAGLALAPDQLDFSLAAAPGGLTSSGGTFLHGVNAGLEARW